jgi:predicted Zn-dependent protease
MSNRQMKIVRYGVICLIAILLIGCALSSSEVLLQSEDTDVAMGRKMSRQVEQTIGHYEHGDLNKYVTGVMKQVGEKHDDQRFYYQVKIVDQADANAFAAPGGYIYVSRGLLAVTNNEAELAHILGHEIIHISKRHAARRLARARVPTLLTLPGLMVGGVLSERLGDLVNAPVHLAGGAVISQHSRQGEFESDHMGQNLAANAGYDPMALPAILERMGKVDLAKTGKTRKVSFFDTHPTTPDRIDRLLESGQGLAWSPQPGISGQQAAYIRRLEGMLVDDNPASGLFKGQQFFQPVMDFSVTFPEGWKVVNTPKAVVGMAPKKEAVILLSIAGEGIPARERGVSTRNRLKQEYNITPTQDRPVTLNGLPGYLLTLIDTTGKEPMNMHFLWFDYKGANYRFNGMGREHHRPFLKAAALSFRPLTAEEKASIKEKRLRVVTARENETLEQLSRRSGNVWKPAYTAAINGMDVGQVLKVGTLVKVAVENTFRP